MLKLQQPAELTVRIWQELLPTHGRLAGSLRTAIAICIAAFILLALRTPAIAPGVFLIFLVSYDSPYLTLSNSIFQLTFQCVGIGSVLVLLAATGNDPLVRFIAVPVFAFFAAYFLRASTRPIAFMNIGIFSIITLGTWESHLPPETLVHLSIWPVGTGALAVGCKVAIEYLFTRRDPRYALEREMEARLEATEGLFRALAQGSPEQVRSAGSAVTRYAISGQAKMLSLLQEVQIHPTADYIFRIPPASIASLARLLDLSASYVRTVVIAPEEQDRQRFARIATALKCLREGNADDARAILQARTGEHRLATLESIVSNIATTSTSDVISLTPVAQSRAWLRTDAWSNPEYAIYATKISLCTAITYFAYNVLAWPGISTATLTVMIAGLTTTGASNQKILFRLLGSTIGGILFGVGCTVFVYPNADSALPFFLTIGLVSFIAAWTAKSAHIGYVGLQIAFSFFLVAFEGFAAPTQLAPARDRIVGVLLALFVMWMIFHQFHPERTIDKMRKTLARLLAIEAELFHGARTRSSVEIASIRIQAVELIRTIRDLAEVVPYDVDSRMEQDLQVRETIQDAASNSTSVLLLGIASLLHPPEAPDKRDLMYSELELLGEELQNMSRRLSGTGATDRKHEAKSATQDSTIDSQHELWRFCAGLESQCVTIEESLREETSLSLPALER